MDYYLGIDLGGTNIAVGLVDEAHRIVGKKSVKTRAPRSPEELCGDMAAVCGDLVADRGIAMEEIVWVGVGTPGVVWNGTVCYSSNLGLRDAPLAGLLAQGLQRPVYLQNDANTAAFGEYVAGAGKGRDFHSMVIMTIGTGIGSGMILGGKIHDGFNGAAAELGHTVIQPGGRKCPCGNHGCVEVYCSASALAYWTARAMEENPDSALWRLCGGDIRKADAKVAFVAMREGDSAAAKVVEQFLEYLALCTTNVINLIQPEVFCIGGGVSREGDEIVVPLRRRVEAMTFAGREGLRTEILTATLGNDAGIIGAAMLGNGGAMAVYPHSPGQRRLG